MKELLAKRGRNSIFVRTGGEEYPVTSFRLVIVKSKSIYVGGSCLWLAVRNRVLEGDPTSEGLRACRVWDLACCDGEVSYDELGLWFSIREALMAEGSVLTGAWEFAFARRLRG